MRRFDQLAQSLGAVQFIYHSLTSYYLRLVFIRTSQDSLLEFHPPPGLSSRPAHLTLRCGVSGLKRQRVAGVPAEFGIQTEIEPSTEDSGSVRFGQSDMSGHTTMARVTTAASYKYWLMAVVVGFHCNVISCQLAR